MPHLADVPDLSGLAALARDPRLDLKPVVLRVQSDLFAVAPPGDPAMLREFEALALGLIPTVDAATAAIVARKLAALPETPETVLAALARLGGDARTAILTLTPRLSAPVLDAALAAGGDLGPLVALRGDLSAAAIRELVLRDDPRIDRALALNAAVPLTDFVLETLVSRARRRPAAAAVLLARTEIADVALAPLYLFADEARRADIRAGVATLAALNPAAKRSVGREDGPVLTALSARRDVAGFRDVLADALGLADPRALDLAAPDLRDGLALALRAIDLPREDAVYIFLTLDPAVARSVQAVNGLARLFREAEPPIARLLLASILDAPELAGTDRATARHVPHLDPTSVRPRAGRVSRKPAERQTSRPRRTGEAEGR